MKFDTYLFDFDGTLVDSMPSYKKVMLQVLDGNDLEYPSDIVKIITPLGYQGTAVYFQNLGLEMETDEIIALIMRYMLEEYQYHIQAKQNVIQTIKELKRRGADLHVLTASPHSLLDICLKRLGIYELFTNVWSCDDFNTGKDDPEIYQMAAQKIGKPVEEILFLDDNYNADKTAKTAGMKVCGVYDKSSDEYVEEMKGITDYFIYDFKELLEL